MVLTSTNRNICLLSGGKEKGSVDQCGPIRIRWESDSTTYGEKKRRPPRKNGVQNAEKEGGRAAGSKLQINMLDEKKETGAWESAAS